MIVALIHFQQNQFANQGNVRQDNVQLADWQLEEIHKYQPEAASVRPASLGGIECAEVLDSDQNTLGYAAFTLPIASATLGFSGPTNTLMVFSPNGQVRSAFICESADTRDHVESIRNDPQFLLSLQGKSVEQLRNVTIDGVSGATLTSLAIVESIRLRFSPTVADAAPSYSFESLKFPEEINPNELSKHLPSLDSIRPDTTTGLYNLLDSSGETIGQALRLSPAADNIVGYQGPTDALLLFSADASATRLIICRSYDNEPYTDYVADDDYFCHLFRGFTIKQLAKLDAESIEGVSGATMTSQSVASSIVQAASELNTYQIAVADYALAKQLQLGDSKRLSLRDASTLLITAMGCLLALTRLKRHKTLRLLFQLVLIGWLGLVNGDMISQALWLGWAQHGILWRNVLGLLALSTAALVVPLLTGQNAYCAHLCPHGAVQQLVRGRIKWRLQLSSRVQKALKTIPVALLILVVAIGILGLPISPVDLEPFDAWIWNVAGVASITIAIAGIALSLVVPMGYCRFGCPTGLLLNSFRRVGPRWSTQDTLAGLFLFAAGVMHVLFSFPEPFWR